MKSRLSIIREYNSFFLLPTIRVSSERNGTKCGFYYFYIDLSWLNYSLSFKVLDE